MDRPGNIDKHETLRRPFRRECLSKVLLHALVVLGTLSFRIHIINLVVHHIFVQGTSFEPANWPSIRLDGRPDGLAINYRDGSIFLPIDGDIYKYSSNLSLLTSTATQQSTPKLLPTNITSHYINKILKIIKFNNQDLLLSCWQNANNSLKCVGYRVDDLKSVPLLFRIADNNNTINYVTEPSEELHAFAGNQDVNYLLIITNRLRGGRNEHSAETTQSLPALGQFKIMKSPSTRTLALQLTTVLPYRNELNKYLLYYDYRYVFNYEDYTYFLLNDFRKLNLTEGQSEDDIINSVKLARVCRNDTALTSYTEISINCNNQKNLYAKNGYLDTSKPANDQILYIVVEKNPKDVHKKPSTTTKSHLCSYSMRLIQDVFHRAVSDCHAGHLPAALLGKLHPETDQVPICQKNPTRDWCTSATNPFIDGSANSYLVKEDSYIQLDGLSSVNFFYSVSQGKSNPKDVYFIGTESGLLTKIGSDEEPFYTIDLFGGQVRNFQIEGEKLSSLYSNETFTSRKGAKYTAAGDEIYAITDHQVHSLHIDGCQFYTSCHTCLTTRDPLQCIWCDGSCSVRDSCDISLQNASSCPPIIKNFSPLHGPLTGNTRLTIVGESFGSAKGSVQIHVANQECKVDWKASNNHKIECILKPVEKAISSFINMSVHDDTGYIALAGNAQSRLPYTYKKVLIAGNYPGYVTINSSSEITIVGENLDAGAERKILFNDVECFVTKVERHQLMCSVRPQEHELSVSRHGFKGYLKLIVDGVEQEYSNSTNSQGNLSNVLEIGDPEDKISSDSAIDSTQQDVGIFNFSNLFLTLVVLATLTFGVIYLLRYEGFSHIRIKVIPSGFGAKNDLEAAKVNLRDDNHFNAQHDLRSRPSESLSGLIKLNDLTGDYFSKVEQLEQDKPLMQDLVNDEMMSILKQEKILIERNRLTLGHVLGSGQFGRVYKGFLKVDSSGEHATVAVKTLHNRCHWDDSDNNQAFLEEGLMMKDFAHENVLALIGVTFDANGLPMVITPFMLYGDLRSYISDEASSPTVKELIEFGIQVAKGMAYLSNLKFVHRDLAARNCMLDENLTVKVADFGLSRDIYERDYYSSDNKKAKLPVKWMAIESLEKSVYSTKTDVWSYGVLLWELMTRGVVPYPDVDNFDLFSYLKEGRRMLRPRYCPVNLFRIMQGCWSALPEDRPTFDELVTSVSNVITQLQEAKDNTCGQQKVSRDETYCDVIK